MRIGEHRDRDGLGNYMTHLSWLWRRGTDGSLTSSLAETIWSNIQHAQIDSNPVGVQRPLRGYLCLEYRPGTVNTIQYPINRYRCEEESVR